MSFFRRRPSRVLPANIVDLMERFGRFEIDPQSSTDDAHAVWSDTQAPLLEAASADAGRFIAELAEVCIPAGGWTSYGAERTVINLIGLDPPGPDWPRLLDASIEFLRANGVPPMRVAGYMWSYWVDSGGSANTWLPPRPAPSLDAAGITPLADGQVRRIVQLGPGDANAILVRREGARYVAMIDAKYSADDPTRSQADWKSADSLYDLYLDVGISTQMYFWADPEFEPFLPLPKPLI